MKNLTVEFGGIDWLPDEEVEQFDEEALLAYKTLVEKLGPGSEFTGWVDLPVDYDKEEFARIKIAADKIRRQSQVLIVCGIGGSYLGAAAAIDFLRGSMYNLKLRGDSDVQDIEVYFVGNNLTPAYIADVIDLIGDRDFSVNVISKSGTTMETSISFRIFRKMLENRYGKEGAADRIYATTDSCKGALKALADEEGYETFVVPDDIGGRYSVLTAVGLLPIAAAGCDIDSLMEGAASMREELMADPEEINEAMAYAALRQQLYDWDKYIEIFANYDPDLRLFGEWLKQLFGESEGKEGYGIFPASVSYTADLHSMGQMIQQGERNIFETVINIESEPADIVIPDFDDDFDGFKYLEGKPVAVLNQTAVDGVAMAHIDGEVPQVYIGVAGKDEFSLGELFYFFEFVCGVSAYIEGVNPFNQPGVEAYKKNIKELLSKYMD